ncbi:xanthine dehydrogenase family protein molybdopterin-binding subunit [Frigidibacter sp. SD6-1]|uniref:xanthine dehydrogenase family protein molybdopterin-binding subunit n=1 Tax=Frigidibacter sp. SD6-1 TaxID=3032581 RepID=UPI0024DF5911|nr:xanthine dehydrogenase family protein molybdopterin-binding subunit [Frigidibacter sp. SD6-1]
MKTVRLSPADTDDLLYVGRDLQKPDVKKKVTGQAVYTEDIDMPGLAEGRLLHCPHPFARVKRIDTSKAEALPGVLAVLTAKDAPEARFSRSTMAEALPSFAFDGERQDQRILTDLCRYRGDCVAAVAAEDIYVAEQALDLIEVEYELLQPVFDPFEAMKPGAVAVHDDVKNNIAFEMDHPFNMGDTGKAFDEADVVVEFSGVNSRQKHLHMETDSAIAHFDETGRLTVISPSQGPHLGKKHLSERVFPDLNDGDIRWISPAIGGGFGARLALGLEPVAVLLARHTGRPIRVTSTREEDFNGYSSRTDQHQTVRLAAKSDGTVIGIEQHIVSDAGAYLSHSATTSLVNMQKSLGLFRCENVYGHVKVVYTNTPVTAGFRGYGNAEGAFVLQQAIDMLAERLGMDPIEIRAKNIRKEGEQSFFIPCKLEHSRLQECIDEGAKAFDWANKFRGWDRQKDEGRFKRGVGMSILNHASGAGGFLLEHSSAIMKVQADGSANLVISPCEMGQGILGALAQVAAELSGVPYDKIRIVTGDTDVTLFDIGSHASRSMFVVGNAVADCARKINAIIRERAVPHFEKRQIKVTPDQLVAKGGEIYPEGQPDKAIPIGEVAHDEIYNFSDAGAQITASGSYLSTSHHPNHQAAFAEVEVDTETGHVSVLRYLAAHDIGRAINPLLVESQMQGAAVQGLGFALKEDFVLDQKTGEVLNDTLLTYLAPTVMDVPELETLMIEDPFEKGPLGAKGVGEAGVVNPAAAVANAIYDAIGVRLHSVPMTPEKVLAMLQSGGAENPAGSSCVSGQRL